MRSEDEDRVVVTTVETTTIAQMIVTRLKILIAATVVLYLINFGLGYFVYNVSVNNAEGLCAFRTDAEVRLANAKQYLADHPNGTPDIPASILRATISNGERTVKSLSEVNCPPIGKSKPTPVPEKEQPSP
jgi:hypothetical protein